jgi:hypothetical protein
MLCESLILFGHPLVFSSLLAPLLPHSPPLAHSPNRVIFIYLPNARPLASFLQISLAFMIQTFTIEKDKHGSLHKISLARRMGDHMAIDTAYSGVVDWRETLRGSRVDFSGYILARERSYHDSFDKMYKEEVLRRFPFLFPEKQK